MKCLPDIKMVNKMKETTIRGAQKTVDPPLLMEDDGVIGSVRLTPNGVTMVRAGRENALRTLNFDARIDFGFQVIEDVRRSIREAFYFDMFQLAQGPQMTATEVMQRTEEKLRLMGPVLGRQQSELLRPLIERLYGIMYRRKLIEQPPMILSGRKIDVQYSSLVARVQRASDSQSIQRAFGSIAPFIQVDPKVVDNFNLDEAARHIADINGVPQKLIRDRDEIEKIRQARDAANQKMLEMQQQQHESDVAAKVGPVMNQAAQIQQNEGG
jgi:hypothetical protein